MVPTVPGTTGRERQASHVRVPDTPFPDRRYSRVLGVGAVLAVAHAHGPPETDLSSSVLHARPQLPAANVPAQTEPRDQQHTYLLSWLCRCALQHRHPAAVRGK